MTKKDEKIIMLTVDEAKYIADALWVYLPKYNDLDSKEWSAYHFLESKIEQAEVKQLKKEITQLKKEQARDDLEIERLEENYKNLKYSVLEVGTEKCNE